MDIRANEEYYEIICTKTHELVYRSFLFFRLLISFVQVIIDQTYAPFIFLRVAWVRVFESYIRLLYSHICAEKGRQTPTN